MQNLLKIQHSSLKLHIFWRIVIAIIGIILFGDGLMLLMMGKIHLGIALPLLFGLFLIIYSLLCHRIHQQLQRHPQLNRLWKLSMWTFGIWLLTVLVFFGWIASQNRSSKAIPPVKAIVVLGSGIEHGKPSPTLQLRLNRAAQLAKDRPQSLVIVSGGLDFGETQTEAAVMAQNLTQQAIAPQRISLEDQSTSTALNLINSKPILQQHQIALSQPIAIVSSDFHLARAKAIAIHEGYQNPIMVGSSTPLITRYNAWLREYFAFLSGWVLREY